MRIDVNAFVGHYPFRRVEGGSPAALLEAMAQNEIDEAWVGNLPAIYYRDPTEGNAALYRISESHRTLRPVPAVHPGLTNWRAVLDEAVEKKAPMVRTDPTFYGVAPAGAEMSALLARTGERGLPVAMTVKLEDGRQRHPSDGAGELAPWMVRSLLRLDGTARLIIAHADRDFIEQVHYGATPAESGRVLWDISWLWGPPMDDFQHLVETVGADRFCFGTGMPLRIPESSLAKLDLLRCTPTERLAIESGNVLRWIASR